MASWTGILEPSIFVEDTLRCSSTIAAALTPSPVSPVFALESVIPLDAGGWASNLPIIENEAGWTGTKVNSFLDDYYYRIHVTPAVFDFGAVLSELVDTFIVWNAFFVQKSCLNIDETYPDEYDLTGEATPFDLAALEYQTFTLTIPKEGSAQFDAAVTFDFGAAGTRVVTLSGIRLIVFAFPPLWPVSESLEWLTDIMTARDGSEQRMSVRQIPRQSFNFNVPLKTEKEQARFDAAIFGWQKRMWGLPVWIEKVLHTTAINATALTITVDTTNADFRDDSYAIIWKSLNEYEAVKVSTVAAGSLTLESAVVATYTGSKWIMPLRIAQSVGMQKGTHPGVAAVRMASILFAVKDNVLLTGFVPAVNYDGLTVLADVHRFMGIDKEISSDPDSFSQDYESGDFDSFSDSDFNLIMHNFGFVKESKSDIWNFRKFLHSLYGMQAPVYAPTFREDLVATDTIGAADTNFRIENIKLAENMGLNDLRTHLAFIFPNGTKLYREITGIVEADATEEIISIDSALGVEVAIGACYISFLDKCRMASDMVTMDHLIGNKMNSNLSFIAVKE
jgi:hypothetical protein